MSTAARTGVLIVNPNAGSERETPEALAALLPSLELRTCEPADLRRELVQAVAAGADVVAAAGGDGTIRTAANVLAHTDSTLLPVPLGTFNHFARSIGIDSLEAAAEALEHGVATRIDLGDVNDETFVNNASIGWYAEMLKTRARLSRRLPRQLAKVAALVVNLPTAPRFDVEVAGASYKSWLVWVGNGTLRADRGSSRRSGSSLTDHLLDVRILVADKRLARFRAALALLSGNVEDSDALQRFTTSEATFRVGRAVGRRRRRRRRDRPAATLCFRSIPDALSVLPSPSWGADAATSVLPPLTEVDGWNCRAGSWSSAAGRCRSAPCRCC